MRVLITGNAGLLGSRLSKYILDNIEGSYVIGLDNFSGGYLENVDKRVKQYNVNVEDSVKINEIFENEAPEIVYHFSAYAAEGLSPFIRTFNYNNNLIATANIINNCIKHSIKRLIFTSTMAVYGKGNPPFDEDDQQAPIDPYGIAKYACEMDIKVAGEQHGLDWCIIRPHNVYGIGQNIWDKYRNVLGIWMYQHINGMPMTIFGDGNQTRAFSYIDDCLEGLYKASHLESCSKQIINLGGTIPYSINEANEILRNVIGGGEVIHLEQRHEVKEAHPTWEKSVRLLDYKDNTSLYDGLKEMWDWAIKQPNRKRFEWENFELDKGIYSFWKK